MLAVNKGIKQDKIRFFFFHTKEKDNIQNKTINKIYYKTKRKA